MTENERAELERLRYEARLFNAALYATVRDYQILEGQLSRDWRSIDTAPKDGTWILGYDAPYSRVVQWSHNTDQERWNDGEYDFAPTHWMPLPATPQSSLRPPQSPQSSPTPPAD